LECQQLSKKQLFYLIHYQNSEQYEQLFSLIEPVVILTNYMNLFQHSKLSRSIIQHNAISNGSDILVKDRHDNEEYGVEVKGSLTTNWKFTFNDLGAEKKEMYKKQNGSECIKHYLIGGAFLALYCTKKASVYGKPSINIGSKMCKKCKEYHRILKLQKYDKLLDERISIQTQLFYTERMA